MVIKMKYLSVLFSVARKLYPVVSMIAGNIQLDGKLTKAELYAIIDAVVGEQETIYFWGKPNAQFT